MRRNTDRHGALSTFFPRTQYKPAMTALSADSGLVYLRSTAVRYDPADPVGKALAVATLAPIILLTQLGALVCVRRDWQTLCLLVGMLLGSVATDVLKELLQEPRPPSCELSDFGMPSNHAQCMAFFSTFVTAYLVRNVDCPALEKVFYSSSCIAATGVVGYSRVHLGYHTTSQVFAGAALGTALGLGWYAFYDKILRSFGPWVSRWSLARWFKMRDYSHIRNIQLFEYLSLMRQEKPAPQWTEAGPSMLSDATEQHWTAGYDSLRARTKKHGGSGGHERRNS